MHDKEYTPLPPFLPLPPSPPRVLDGNFLPDPIRYPRRQRPAPSREVFDDGVRRGQTQDRCRGSGQRWSGERGAAAQLFPRGCSCGGTEVERIEEVVLFCSFPVAGGANVVSRTHD